MADEQCGRMRVCTRTYAAVWLRPGRLRGGSGLCLKTTVSLTASTMSGGREVAIRAEEGLECLEDFGGGGGGC